MTNLVRRLRPVLIGLIALILTAGVVLAARPAASAVHPSAASHASRGADVANDDGDEAPDEDGSETEAADENGGTGGDNCATDPGTLTPEELAATRHGSIVCWAAHQETPEGYRNHGAFVSEWAKKNHGADSSQLASHGSNGKSHKP